MIDFFIKRPIFTSVCSFVIIVAGLICIPILPISQYPELAPPMITVSSVYTGANSEVVETTVTTPLEQAINGVEGMKYMSSTSGNDGSSTIQITFDLERDKDIAAVDVQNSISTVMGTLPEELTKTGITVSKQSTAIISAYAFFAENNEYDDIYISNYVDKFIIDDLKRIPGVGSVSIAGERKYSMRIWVDPVKLTARGLTPSDVVNAISDQNVQVPAGQIGEPPIREDQAFQFTIQVPGRLTSPEEFDEIIISASEDGSLVKIKDIGHSELGSQSYDTALRYNKKPSVGIMIYQLADANALQVYNDVDAKIAELAKDLPPGLKYELAFETVSVVKESIQEVIFTLILAIILVVSVVFLFLQSWRTTLIPVITIPVSLIGTFAFLKVFGFSINTLSLFGIVLATGLVVDDAIVVIENIERNMTEKGMNAIQASIEGMKEVTGAVIASTLVLAAVFLPVAAFPGTTGQLYKQFALTIVFSVSISLFNALTLTPALSALLLKPEKETDDNKFFHFVNKVIYAARDKYQAALEVIVKYKAIMVVVFIALLGLTYYLFTAVPGGFVPNEDQGYFITSVQGPEGTSLNYTSKVVSQVEEILSKQEEVRGIFSVLSYSFSGNGPNQALIFTSLKPLDERAGVMHSARMIVLRLNKAFSQISEAIVMSFEPPALRGIGNVGGFQFELLDHGGHTLNELADAKTELVKAAQQSEVLTGIYSSFTANTPQLEVNIDRTKVKKLGIPMSNLFNTIKIYLGSQYVNDFTFLDRVYRVYVQANKTFRTNPEDIKNFYVRSNFNNALVPLSTLIEIHKEYTSQTISHYNLFRSAEITGSEAPGYSSGQAIAEMEKLADTVLPQGFGYQWSGISLEQIKAGQQGIIFFALGLLFVYLVLAAQYESLVDPLIIILAVPLAIFGALLAQMLRGLDNDVFCQIGLVMLIGLACKNSILIVEFANHLKATQGYDSVKAVVESCKVRFRPILMTSLAFIFGIFPLVIATGAGSASRQSMGTAVFGGMFFSTILSLFIVPIVYLVIKDITAFSSKLKSKHPKKQESGETGS
jgi:HAE1 family hydrophobic/amphiphilic exporter-1